MEKENKRHWETVYETKNPDQVSWTQDKPTTSLDFIHSFDLPKTARIIDVGGGDSKLVDHLLAQGYENITVLDISSKAIEKAKERLGENANKVKWIVSDIIDFKPQNTYDIWHDRAVFHFLTTKTNIERYTETANSCINGYLIIGTFSENGPLKCSGLAIKQYDESSLTKAFSEGFDKIDCLKIDHVTPFKTIQNFQFCSFKRK